MACNGKPNLKWMIWGYLYFWKHPHTSCWFHPIYNRFFYAHLVPYIHPRGKYVKSIKRYSGQFIINIYKIRGGKRGMLWAKMAPPRLWSQTFNSVRCPGTENVNPKKYMTVSSILNKFPYCSLPFGVTRPDPTGGIFIAINGRKDTVAYCWWFRIPARKPPGIYKAFKKNGIHPTYELVQDFFHQLYSPNCGWMVICHDRTSTIILNKHKHLDDWMILFSMEGRSESMSRKPKLEPERKKMTKEKNTLRFMVCWRLTWPMAKL